MEAGDLRDVGWEDDWLKRSGEFSHTSISGDHLRHHSHAPFTCTISPCRLVVLTSHPHSPHLLLLAYVAELFFEVLDRVKLGVVEEVQEHEELSDVVLESGTGMSREIEVGVVRPRKDSGIYLAHSSHTQGPLLSAVFIPLFLTQACRPGQ